MRLLPLFLFCLVVGTPASADPAEDQRFKTLSEREYAWAQADNSGGEDDERIAPHLQDVRPAAQAKRLAYLQQVLAELEAIKPARLSPATAVDYQVYRFDIERRIASLRFRDYEMPARPYTRAGVGREDVFKDAEITNFSIGYEPGQWRAALERYDEASKLKELAILLLIALSAARPTRESLECNC